MRRRGPRWFLAYWLWRLSGRVIPYMDPTDQAAAWKHHERVQGLLGLSESASEKSP
jgi:hypothetical protein